MKSQRANRKCAEAGPLKGPWDRTCAMAPSLGLLSSGLVAAAIGLMSISSPARAQDETLPPTPPTVACPAPLGQDLVMPPELVSSNGILSGTLNLTEEFQRLPAATTTAANCPGELVRIFRGEGLASAPPAEPPNPDFADPIPGPTLRARVGDLIQLSFVNQVNPNRFDLDLDIDACMEVGEGGETYPGDRDTPPNCLHASSTANIHFHGTHTNPDSTGDNVYLQIRPLPRDNQGNLTTTPAEASVGFDEFFQNCTAQLSNPLNTWPSLWSDMPQAWVDKQTELLMAYQQQVPSQPIWDRDQAVIDTAWPQYYLGAVPYCFALPAYTEAVWPPPPGSTSPNMGQAPGTHWYHAHKHGSTAINVMNGMTGAFIIEGQYDDDLNAAYGHYVLADGEYWNTRSQPIFVLNQLGVAPTILTDGATPLTPRQISVNGRMLPTVRMQPGEIQLWRIVNTAGRSAAYFMAPQGLQWRQLAQDGVQFADQNYQDSLNRPLYIAPGNRVDLLVQAPMTEMTSEILIQNVVGRARVKPTPANPTAIDPNPGIPLMTVTVAGLPIQQYGNPVQMPFLGRAPDQPPFLADISDAELRSNNYSGVTLDFNSKARGSAVQHTINDLQFEDGNADVSVTLGTVEEWTIKNSTPGNPIGAKPPLVGNPGSIDHPFHIHINPFQITEVFDPNEYLVNPATGQLEGTLVDNKTVPIPRYVFSQADVTDPARQCVLNADDPSTWEPCRSAMGSGLVWWDVFAIPSGRLAARSDGTVVTVPGYFKMRSRFVDYPGVYVLHCHILIHEDRGMMFSVEVGESQPLLVKHH